jgi:uncharacterized protein involved in exopolysaccharide biosynthesis
MAVLPSNDFDHTPPRSFRWLRYLTIGIVVNLGIFGGTALYIKKSEPVFVSKWSVSLPEQGLSSRVSIPDLGSASTDVRSPYSDRMIDPREKYKFLATSSAVLSVAADKLGIERKEIGRPRVEVIDNTSMMAMELEGDSPEDAQRKAIAIQEALDSKIEQLREQETLTQKTPLAEATSVAENRLQQAQAALDRFIKATGLVSQNQIDQVASNLEGLKRERVIAQASSRESQARFSNLRNNLSLAPQEASDAFVLRSDGEFQQYLTNYNSAASTLVSLEAKYGENHPAIKRERLKEAEAEKALLARGQVLLGYPPSLSEVARLNISSSQGVSERGQLLQDLITSEGEQSARLANVTEMDRQIVVLEQRLATMNQNLTTLQKLQRDLKIAETIYSTRITELGTTGLETGSYPPLQLLSTPSLPPDARSPKKSISFAGAAMGSVAFSLALFSLWLRPFLLAHYRAHAAAAAREKAAKAAFEATKHPHALRDPGLPETRPETMEVPRKF